MSLDSKSTFASAPARPLPATSRTSRGSDEDEQESRERDDDWWESLPCTD